MVRVRVCVCVRVGQEHKKIMPNLTNTQYLSKKKNTKYCVDIEFSTMP